MELLEMASGEAEERLRQKRANAQDSDTLIKKSAWGLDFVPKNVRESNIVHTSHPVLKRKVFNGGRDKNAWRLVHLK